VVAETDCAPVSILANKKTSRAVLRKWRIWGGGVMDKREAPLYSDNLKTQTTKNSPQKQHFMRVTQHLVIPDTSL
jgi:hypothetical protein